MDAQALPARQTRTLHRFANPGRFLRLARAVQPVLTWPAVLLGVGGLVWGLLLSPADWQQGDSVRIMYVHVPAAWLASAGYASLALCGFASLVWRHPLADLAAAEIGPVGAGFTALCLTTGSLWGKPMWGAWWVWDARLTSVLVLFFLYLGHIALVRAFDDPVRGARAGAVLALAGAVNLPIIKFSVDWWNTLHQPATITLTAAPGHVTRTCCWPLLACALGATLVFAAIVLARLRAAVMERRHARAADGAAWSGHDAPALRRRVLCARLRHPGRAGCDGGASAGPGAAHAGRGRSAARDGGAWMTRKRRRLWLVLACVAGLGSATALGLNAFSDNLVFFVAPSDLHAHATGQAARCAWAGWWRPAASAAAARAAGPSPASASRTGRPRWT